MTTATIGRIDEYRPENELLSSYLERVDAFFSANEINDEKQVPAFLSLIGSKIYSLFSGGDMGGGGARAPLLFNVGGRAPPLLAKV